MLIPALSTSVDGNLGFGNAEAFAGILVSWLVKRPQETWFPPICACKKERRAGLIIPPAANSLLEWHEGALAVAACR